MSIIDLTIFTPTYNRVKTLPRLYESLLSQKNKSFEWLIIDDGSKDETEKLIEKYIEDSIINIRYIRQENKGKQSAWNNAVLNARGRYFIGIDSDDALFDEYSIDIILKKYVKFIGCNVVGLRFLAYSNVKKDFDGDIIDEKIKVQSWFNEFGQANLIGERVDVYETNFLIKYLYPVKKNIKFIPEIWFYTKVSADNLKYCYVPIPIRMFYDDNPDGRLSKSSVYKNAEGHYISRATMLKNIPMRIFLRNYMAWVKCLIRFSQCANFLSVNFFTRKKDTNLIYAILSFPIGFILK